MNTQAVQRERYAAQILIVGYGNELRGDDAVGVRIARAVETWELPNVCVLTPAQLTPELAATLAGVEFAIFVDAGPGAAAGDFRLAPVAPSEAGRLEGHIAEPGDLLGLTAALYQRSPQAWYLTIPPTDMSFGAGLSAETARGMVAALRYLRDQLPRLGRHLMAEG
jgi:hydrogenase maturation protease